MSLLPRRTFIRHGALAAGAVLASRFQPSALAAPAGANEAIRVGLIGLNGKGSAHLKNLLQMKDVRLTALCDVDPRVLARVGETLKGKQVTPFMTTDAREVFARSDVDAVMIVTSNHWHALLTVWACQAGKDVYVEKPMSHTVWEGRKMIEAAAKYDRIVQVGTQYRSEPGLAAGIKYLREGKLGKIKYVRAVVYTKREAIGRKAPWTPDWLNYDLFCGPTPLQPLERNQLHYDWHWTWDTGNGELGNNGVHVLDISLRIAGHAKAPRRVLSYGGRYVIDDSAQTPNTHVALYDYADIPLIFEHRALPAKPGVTFMDQHGGLRTGVIAQCEGGYLAGLVGATAYSPDGKVIEKFPGDGGAGHLPNFFAAVRSRRKQDLAAPVETGHLSASLCHYGNISYRVGTPLAAAPAEKAMGDFPIAGALQRELHDHLRLHGVEPEKQPFRVGPWLKLDASGDGIAAVDSGGPTTLEQARALLRERHRPAYAIPEQV
jgi:predicted dehydrogenase